MLPCWSRGRRRCRCTIIIIGEVQRTSVDRHLHGIIQVVVLAAVKGAVVADTADGENEGAGITFHPTAEECN